MIALLLLAAATLGDKSVETSLDAADTSVRATCLPVEGDRILIGAIPGFVGSDPDESIGFAPAPGAQRRFSVGELGRLAARKGVIAPTEPVCFERPLFTLTREQVTAAVRESLPQGAELEVIEFSHSRIPKGSLEFPRGGLGRPAAVREPTIWRGRVKYTAAQSVPVWAKVRAWISRPAAVAVEDLHIGKPIEASQVRVESRDGNPFAEIAPVSFDGMTPRRPIRGGEVISQTALEASADVARGEMVGVEARYGAALVKFEVRAEAAGRAGDSITVRNVESGKTFRARVLRKGWVGVEQTE